MVSENKLVELRIEIHQKAQALAEACARCYGMVPILAKEIVAYTGFVLKYNPDQPRVPAGNPDGGEWAPGGGRDKNPDDNQDASQPADKLSISKEGIDYLKRRERFSSTVYLDQAKNPTIGYGHRLGPDETYPNGVTREEAEQLLSDDLGIAEDAVRNNVTVNLTQNQFDALTSLAYNIGAHNFENSTLLDLLNQGDYNGAADQFLQWNKITVNGRKEPSSGLTNRRNQERNIFLYGNYQ